MSSQPVPLTSAKIDRLLVRRYIFAGLCASLDSIGLARFAFTPLIPELIQAHWFSASSTAYLAAANLAGYVCGALIGRPIATRLANEHVLRLMMVLISAAFFACAVPLSFSWYFVWRFVSGIAGGVVMAWLRRPFCRTCRLREKARQEARSSWGWVWASPGREPSSLYCLNWDCHRPGSVSASFP